MRHRQEIVRPNGDRAYAMYHKQWSAAWLDHSPEELDELETYVDHAVFRAVNRWVEFRKAKREMEAA